MVGNDDSLEGPRPSIVVSPTLTDPHPWVAAAATQLQNAVPSKEGLVSTDPATGADIRVRPPNVARALSVLDALAKGWTQEGGEFGKGTYKQRPCTILSLEPAAVAIYAGETTAPIRRGRSVTTQLTGGPLAPRFCLVLNEGELQAMKAVWADTTTLRVEKMIRPMLDQIKAYLLEDRAKRLDEQCVERQESRAREMRRAKADLHHEHFALRNNLLQDVNNWHDAERIRAYLNRIEEQIKAGEMKISKAEQFERWIKWARWYAADIDPLVKAPPWEQPAIMPTNTPADQLDLTQRTRRVIESLRVQDTDSLAQLKPKQMRAAAEYDTHVWDEITRVLQGLGYDVSKRDELRYQW